MSEMPRSLTGELTDRAPWSSRREAKLLSAYFHSELEMVAVITLEPIGGSSSG